MHEPGRPRSAVGEVLATALPANLGRRAIAISGSEAAIRDLRVNDEEEFNGRCRFSTSSFVIPDERSTVPAQTRRQTMRVMVLVKATEDGDKGVSPTPEALEAFKAMDRFTEELVKAGVFVAAAGLKPSPESKRIAFDGPGRTVIDGPFAETKELVAGFSIWEVKDMDEAVAWAKRSPNLWPGRSEVELRPFLEAADLAEFLTPEELSTPLTESAGSSASPDTVGWSRLVSPAALAENAV